MKAVDRWAVVGLLFMIGCAAAKAGASAATNSNVVGPEKRIFKLDYQDVVTRSMDNLDDRAEWRVRRKNGNVVSVSLIVRVMARENARDPEKITLTYWTVAKIAAGGACVTDRIREGSKSAAQVRALADSASGRPCAARLP
jgi:hypothetical protein